MGSIDKGKCSMLSNCLEGVRVVDFSHVVAGPVCSMTLADLGAHVSKVEALDGEIGRRIGPPWIHGESATFISVNRNKYSLAIDLKTEAGLGAVRKMIQQADVVVENFRPGVMAALGLDFDTVRKNNPRLLYCSISAFGQTGEARHRPGVDGMVQAMSGLMSTLGDQGADPVKVPVPVADMVTGYLAAIAILGALHKVRAGQPGQHLDVSLFNSTLMLQQVGFGAFFADGENPRKTGSAAPYASPNEAFPTADGWMMVVAYHPQRWTALCDMLGLPWLEADPRFATNDDRVRHRAELHGVLAQEFARASTAEWLERLASRDIICAPVRSYREVVASQEYLDSGIAAQVDHPVAGSMTTHGFVLGPSAREQREAMPAPLAGQHSVEVLRSYGVHEDEIAALLEQGALRVAPVAAQFK
jgi:crotonobetainyl-CoA:carnitine CoA-transferase CaiB-like acyl-CoA transferase